MLKRYFRYYIPYKKILLGVIVGSCLNSGIELIFPMLIRKFLSAENPLRDVNDISFAFGVLTCLYCVNYAMSFAIDYYGHIMSSGIENDMRRDIFAHLEKMSFRFYDNNKTGQLLARIMSDVVEVSELTFKGPNDLFVCTIMMLGTMSLMLWINPYLGALISALLIFKCVHTVKVNHKMKRAFRRSRAKSGELSAQTEEALSGIRLTKAFAQEKKEHSRFMSKSNELLSVRKESFGILSYFFGGLQFFTNMTNLAVMTVGGYMVTKNMITPGDFVAFLLLVGLFMRPAFRLLMFTEMYQRGMAGYHRFTEMMDIVPEIQDKANAIADIQIKGNIKFENVSFGYVPGKKVLQNFNLEIKAGEKIAFVGSTGVGKSTICNLLPRFYEIQEGRILIDGVDIKDIKQQFLRSQIGIVQQDVFLFSESVAFNIAFPEQKASIEEIQRAAALAEADSFIQKLEEKYDTCIGERGVKLSGGQKQRLAIARVFLKNPPIVILDEATSSLDNATEKKVQKALNALAADRTTLIVAHRLATVINADRIVVLNEEGIVEQGSHAELMQLQREYYRLYQAQFGNA